MPPLSLDSNNHPNSLAAICSQLRTHPHLKIFQGIRSSWDEEKRPYCSSKILTVLLCSLFSAYTVLLLSLSMATPSTAPRTCISTRIQNSPVSVCFCNHPLLCAQIFTSIKSLIRIALFLLVTVEKFPSSS